MSDPRLPDLLEHMQQAAADAMAFTEDVSQNDFLAELEQLLGRGVDPVEPGAVRNPYVLASINLHREPVYAA